MENTQIINCVGILILLLNAIVYAKVYLKNIHGRTFRVFAYYVYFILLFQVNQFLFWCFKANNIFLLHFYFIIQFVLLSFFYSEIFKNKIQKKIVYITIFFTLTVIGVQYVYEPDVFYTFNLFEIVVTSIPLIMYSILHFYNTLEAKREYFFINVGVFIYFCGSTLLFISGNYIVSSNALLNQSIWIINSVLFVIYQLLIITEWKTSFSTKKTQ